jgi:hypothetical protein
MKTGFEVETIQRMAKPKPPWKYQVGQTVTVIILGHPYSLIVVGQYSQVYELSEWKNKYHLAFVKKDGTRNRSKNGVFFFEDRLQTP